VLPLPERLLVVAAHPDDEVLGCGGLLARVADAGGSARILIVTEGATTQYPGRPDLVAQKRDEAMEAARILGTSDLRFAELPDMQLSTLPSAAITGPIGEEVDSFEPDWVVTHHVGDLNSDHRVVHEACRVAARPNLEGRPALLTMEVPSATEFGYRPLVGNIGVPLTEEQLKRKQEALTAYASEARRFPHGRSTEAVAALAAYRGYGYGTERSEAFELIWGQVR
jgi:N-acetylglucosamine malate deacetylase 1